MANAVVSCPPPIPRHLHCNLKQGKYVNFASLLLPMDPPPLVPSEWQRREKLSHSMCSIMDQQTWLEAWNRYASARIAYDPDMCMSWGKGIHKDLIVQAIRWQVCILPSSLAEQAVVLNACPRCVLPEKHCHEGLVLDQG